MTSPDNQPESSEAKNATTLAIPAPIPLDAPVTTAFFSRSFDMICPPYPVDNPGTRL